MGQANTDKDNGTLGILRDIIKVKMRIPDERIFYYNEDYDLPPDDGIWCIVSFKGSKPYANRSTTFTDTDGNFQERMTVNAIEQNSISLMSYNLEAYTRRYGAMKALRSIYSQQQQLATAVRISPIMQLVDVSHLEGGRINYRFDTMLNMFVWDETIEETPFFDGIETELTTSDSLREVTSEFNPAVNPLQKT